MATLHGNEVASNTVKHGQVYQATHDGSGNSTPFMNRSFISFTYGGKKIEDFNLIATFSSGRLDKNGYSEFEDTVSNYDNLDGQYYWGTHYKANLLQFTLSTDSIDDKMLNNFLHHFRAGESKLLVLAEHPNRGIMARVANPPSLSLLPFEHQTLMTISSETYNITTTEYKGDIQLTFTMDSPHWFSLENILGIKEEENGVQRYVDYWINHKGERISIFASQDALKMLYEDGIPLGSMIDHNMLLGNGSYANVENNVMSLTWNRYEDDSAFLTEGRGARIDGTISEEDTSDYEPGTYYGRIAGAIVDVDGNGISSLSNDGIGYFFYSGTAPAPTEITFSLTPLIKTDPSYLPYILTPFNTIAGTGNYNVFSIESVHKKELKFTTPNFFTSYNKAIQILNNGVNNDLSWTEIREALRDYVRHPIPRTWAIRLLEYCQKLYNNNGKIGNTYAVQTAIGNMKFLICDREGNPFSVTFTFNSETGEASGLFTYRKVPSSTTIINNLETENFWQNVNATNNLIEHNVKEDVGDMLRSNYIVIEDRNFFTSSGKVTDWYGGGILNKANSHLITHNLNVPLTNISILYKNMYL